MKIVNLTQGSPEWHAHRAKHFNASDAPAMMGCSPYKTRAELLRELHSGLAADVDAGTQRIFDAGHRFEAMARPVGEKIVGDDLYPCVGTSGRYSASFDGLTLGGEDAFEHKTLNDQLRYTTWDEGNGDHLPLHYRVQMEHQLLVSGAQRVLFMASKWADDGTLLEERHCWYAPDAELRAALIAGWDQFAKDLAAHVPTSATEPPPVGRAPETLPALRIEVTGAVTASNLAEFKATALAAIRSVNRDIKTDADFADAEKAVKWCGDVESRLKAAKEHALSQTSDIDALFKALDDISAEARTVRLDLDKLVKRRKDEVREQAVTAVRRALDAHIAGLQAELSPLRLLPVPADFAGSIKGLRSIASMQDALDTTLAAAKIAADGQARTIRGNVAAFKAATGDDRALQALFADLGQLVHKAADDFAVVVDARIAKHRADEAARDQARKEAEAARIAEAERRAAAEAEARLRAEQETLARRELDAAEADRRLIAAEEAAQQRHIEDKQAQTGNEPEQVSVEVAMKPQAQTHVSADTTQDANEPATLKLGTICSRLGITMTASFISEMLGIQARATDKRAMLYFESDFQRICAALVEHIECCAKDAA